MTDFIKNDENPNEKYSVLLEEDQMSVTRVILNTNVDHGPLKKIQQMT